MDLPEWFIYIYIYFFFFFSPNHLLTRLLLALLETHPKSGRLFAATEDEK